MTLDGFLLMHLLIAADRVLHVVINDNERLGPIDVEVVDNAVVQPFVVRVRDLLLLRPEPSEDALGRLLILLLLLQYLVGDGAGSIQSSSHGMRERLC